ncbi:histidinol phosphate phosphatase, hisj family, putative [Heliomicrobium modesticaldum Ice1]|uniref:Histidinol-phosphatase n=1 Tax=Heliobacterium modesticaldum (strain ATCC 51547 / Ice1) TaxID=498761 RepID=B0TIC0_HELMI|nr:histidinol phosphate phosphatase [Heliomicrobium modesticaldum]ABZ83540.1 histidinol phosphate phosphatase, hisj family, putative [Heliomicrobium modesticaldum Ice1]
MIFDTHVHTRFSTDSIMAIDQAIEQARQKDIGLIITDHMDLAYPQPDSFTFDVDAFFRTYEPYRSDRLRLGVEMGMRSELISHNRKLAAAYPFDYIIGSIHVVDGVEVVGERYFGRRSKRESYDRYFDTMLECVKAYDFIDSLGHIDYIARYALVEDPEIDYDEFREQIDPILAVLAERQQAIEINARRLDRPAVVEALFPIYRRFAELGGRFVTVGSDAHNPRDIGRNLKAALALAERCRLQPVWYKERAAQPVRT